MAIDYSGAIGQGADLDTQQVYATHQVTASGAVTSGSAAELATFTDPLESRQSVSITNLDATNTIFVGHVSTMTSTVHWIFELAEGENAVLQVGAQVDVYLLSDGGTPTATIVQYI